MWSALQKPLDKQNCRNFGAKTQTTGTRFPEDPHLFEGGYRTILAHIPDPHLSSPANAYPAFHAHPQVRYDPLGPNPNSVITRQPRLDYDLRPAKDRTEFFGAWPFPKCTMRGEKSRAPREDAPLQKFFQSKEVILLQYVSEY